MKNDNDAIAGGIIWPIAYHTFEYPDILPDIRCPCHSDNGWMQQGGPDTTYDQIIGVCKVTDLGQLNKKDPYDNELYEHHK